ncbi:hypothetical protein V2K16_08520 [Pseudomonas alliivorans]|uniref:hypothetical protein n=1 Tax=Pseudomonas alliivorans TaxID=2810613 RepID=UPI002E2C7CB3|nr:hypothetical protein [Pseudomonas alliivorans]MEE4877309.1 hypothetical protein [Pseudomonas alliivorans]MEE4929712.1 hypothetical protein [Pseudomonas alliivorans]MEE4935127.1 hypothetical protein [Pseudomonas alliivorans]MEE4940259.1 hypothetical protein [Pseudomonas alliivorans]MEE4950676.1 hypothetical protein [Pseudomonas alliivorans]
MVSVFPKVLLAAACVFSAITNANDHTLSSEGESLYFRALPFLQKIDELNNEIFTVRDTLSTNEKFPAQKREQAKTELQALLKEALPLLTRSAEELNPAAQYRLAVMISNFDSGQQAVDMVCTLLRASFSQGFTPAGLQMLSYCFDEVKTPEFQALIDALPDNETLYGKYYPQPTLMPSCDKDSRSRRSPIVWIDEKSFRANLYMSYATQMSRKNHEQERLRYLKKAAEHGCDRAIDRL